MEKTLIQILGKKSIFFMLNWELIPNFHHT